MANDRKKIDQFPNVTPISTDIYLLERADGSYAYVTGTQLLAFMSANDTLQKVLTAGNSTGGLPITSPDGTKTLLLNDSALDIIFGSSELYIDNITFSASISALRALVLRNVFAELKHDVKIKLTSPIIEVTQNATTSLGIVTLQQLQSATGSIPTPTLQQVLTAGNSTGGLPVKSPNTFGNLNIFNSSSEINFNDNLGNTSGSVFASSFAQMAYGNGLYYGNVQIMGSQTFIGHDLKNTFSAPSNNFPQETASQIAYLDATKNLKTLPVATYPSLTELAYTKGLTSNAQTQLNGKQPTGTYATGTGSASGTNTGDQTIALTGDVTGSGTGTFATTFATVNANVGAFNNVTVNAKGLVTAASNVAYASGTGSATGTNTGDVAVATTTDITTGTDNVKTVSSLGLVNAGVLKQSQTNIYAVATGTNTYTVTLTPAIITLTAGLTINVLFTNANTTVITVNVNGLGAIAVTKDNITPLVVGDIRAGVIYTMTYDGTRFQCDCGEAFLNSPSFTGLPLAPTASALTNNTQIATTAYADTALATFKTANFLDATSSIQTQINGKQPAGTYVTGTGTVTGTNTGDETIARIATINHSATAKSVLLDADELTGQDSASTFSLFRTTLLNVWTYIGKKFETKTNGGDAAYSVLANDNVVVTGTALTLPRIWTMPSAASVNAGNEKIISDSTGTITTTNTITIAVQSGQYLNNVLNGTEVMTSPNAHRRLFSDGVNNWFFDAGIVRLGATQTLTNKTLVTPVIGSITGVSGVTGLTVVTNNTASGAIARGNNFTPTLVASANSDVLVGLDIQPTFTNGAFTGVTNLASRVNGSMSVGNYATPGTQRVFTVGQDTAWLTIGSIPTATNYIGIWANATTPTLSNALMYAISGQTTIQGAGNLFLGAGGANVLSIIVGKITTAPFISTTGAVIPIVNTLPNNTGQTLSTAIPQVLYTLGNTTWVAGNITTQKFFSITSPSALFTSASTITNAYSVFIDPPIASTGATITNNYALGLGGNLALSVVGSGIAIKEGTNATMNTATLSGGTVTIANTKVTANTRIFLSIDGVGVLANIGTIYEDKANRVAGTSFVVKSSNVLDTSSIAYLLIEPA